MLLGKGPVTTIMKTYSEYSRVIRHLWWRGGLVFFGCFLDPQVLDITSPKHDVFIDIIRRWDFIIRATSFRTKGHNLFEGDGGIFRTDFVECPNIAGKSLATRLPGLSQPDPRGHTECLSSRSKRSVSCSNLVSLKFAGHDVR